jgi:hypothetical protein
LTLANLYRVFSNETFQIEDELRTAIINSLEKRWKKADHDVFLLAVILNPYLRTKVFHPHSPYRTMGTLWPIVERLCKRFWNGLVPDREFRRSFSDYLLGLGEWSDDSLRLVDWKEAAKEDVSAISFIVSPSVDLKPAISRKQLSTLWLFGASMTPSAKTAPTVSSVWLCVFSPLLPTRHQLRGS